MKSKVVPLRIPEKLDELAAVGAREQHTDKATTLRQWLYHGAEQYSLNLVSEGRLSIGRAAELLDTTIFDLQDRAESLGIELGATEQQNELSHRLVKALVESEASLRRPDDWVKPGRALKR
jgi:hypothetical protein